MIPEIHWSWAGFFQLVGIIACGALTLWFVISFLAIATMDIVWAPFRRLWRLIFRKRDT